MTHHGHSRQLVVLLALLGFGTPAHGQQSDSTNATRVLSALAEKLHADATLPDSFRHLTPADLARTMDTGRFEVLLDDSSISLYLHTMAATLHQLPDSVCAELLGDSSRQLSEGRLMFGYVDGATMDNWGIIFERVIRARARSDSAGPMASTDAVQAAMFAIVGRLSQPDQERMMAIATHTPPTSADKCWLSRTITDGMAALPPEQAGPVTRALSLTMQQ